MKRISLKEINKHVGNYARESQSLWRSSKCRIVKVNEAMSLTSVYERIAQAQLEADQKELESCQGHCSHLVDVVIDLEAKLKEHKEKYLK